MLAFLPSFGFPDGSNAQNAVQSKAQIAGPMQRQGARPVSRAAVKKWAGMLNNPTPPTTQIGFLSATQTPASGGTFPSFPAVVGDFTGNGIKDDAAAIVNTSVTNTPTYQIAAAVNNGQGVFTTVLTPTGAIEQDAIFVGDLNGDGKDDILLVHPYASPGNTLIEGWTSNGDGHFTSHISMGVTTNGFVWAALADVNGDGKLDVVLADAFSPGNIWTALGNGDGTFKVATKVPFTGALRPFPPGGSGTPGNPVVFADFNGDGFLDFAGPAATGGASDNQIEVYLCSSGTKPCTSYAAPVALATTDGSYDSCFLGGGDLTGDGKDELVSANCIDNNITVYVNNGSGVFATGVYHTVESNPIAVSVGDMNGDHHNDVVATCSRSADIKVLLGDGTGAVSIPTVGYVTGGSPLVPPLLADFNGDGKLDVVVPDDEFSFVYLEGYGDGSLRSAVNYYSEPGAGVGAAAFNIASGDFNGDGIPDFVIGNGPIGNSASPNYSATVFLSNSDGSLNRGVNYSNPAFTNYSLQYVAVADFNGDGKLDIAATDNFNHVVQIFTGNGDGTFTVGATYKTDTATGVNPVGLIVGDFNGDGKPDLAVVNNIGVPAATADVGILLNNGSGFNPVATYSLSTVATEITTAALRGSGKPLDLIVPLYGTSTTAGSAVAILLGNGNGTFAKETDVQLTNINVKNPYLNPYAAAVGDLNGDGKVDLAVTIEDQTHFNQGIALVLGNGDGTFQANPVLLPTTLQNPAQDVPLPGYVKIADMNQDGTPDLVYSNSQFSTVGILYGKGSGAFYDPVEFPADRWAWGLALVDLKGDGAADVVVSGNSLNFSGVAVLFNDGGNKTTVSSSANPSTPGAPVTFTATVASTVKGVAAIPTGNITFKDGSSTLGSGALVPNGAPATAVATFTANSLADGPHAILAQYPGDSHFLPSVSAVFDQSVGKADGVVSVTLISSANPSGLDQSVTFTAAVADTVNGEPFVPTGTVSFYDGTTLLGSANLTPGSSNSMAAFSTSTLDGGSHSITAQYGGDANFAAKASSPLNQVVATGVVSVTLASSVNPSTPGESVTFTATVKDTVNGQPFVPTGKVTFSDGSTALGSANLNSSGLAALPTSNLVTAGSHNITAQYSGDVNFGPKASSVFTQTVLASSYALSASPSTQTINPGSSATYKITVTPANGYNGTVSFPSTACSGLPTGAACSFNPTTLPGSGSTTLTITTSAHAAAMMSPPASTTQKGALQLWASLGGIGFVGMVLAGDWSRRKRRSLGIVLAILAVMFLITLVGCGGGSSSGSGGGGGGGGGTPAGTSTVQVTVKDASGAPPTSGPLSLTLTVN